MFWNLVNPGYGPIALNEGGGAYAATLLTLQTFLTGNDGAGNPHSLAAMASPPTITAQNTTPAGYDQIYNWDTNRTLFSYYGGGEKVYSTSLRRFPAATIAATGGDCLDGEEATVWRVGTMVTAAKCLIVLNISGGKPRFIVDGQYVDFTGTDLPATGDIRFILDFTSVGGSATRHIVVEAEDSAAFRSWRVPTGSSIAAPAAGNGWRGIVLGDSFTEATGATRRGDGFAAIAGDYLGFEDFWSSGIGATGYVATNGATRYKLSERIAADLDRAKAAGPIDLVVVAMGLNDIGETGIQAEAETCFGIIRSKCPSAVVFVLPPWDVEAPLTPAAGYADVKTAIQAAIGTRGGFYFLDAEGVEYTKSDATHPDDAGHETLGLWLDTAIRDSVGYAFSNAEASALVARFTTEPTFARSALIDDLVGALKTGGVWSKLDALYVMAAADSQAARRNWIADSYNLSAISGPTFTVDEGYTGDGSSSYLDTGFNPTTAPSPKFVQNSATLFGWSLTDLANGAGTGHDYGGGNSYIARDATNAGRATARVNTAVGGHLVGNGAYPGFAAWARSSSVIWEGYAQGVDSGGSGAAASAAPANNNFRIGANHSGFGVNQMAIVGFGSNLSAAEVLAAYNAFDTYLQAVGAV